MQIQKLRERLKALAEPRFQAFAASLIPGEEHLLGVRCRFCANWLKKLQPPIERLSFMSTPRHKVWKNACCGACSRGTRPTTSALINGSASWLALSHSLPTGAFATHAALLINSQESTVSKFGIFYNLIFIQNKSSNRDSGSSCCSTTLYSKKIG